MSKLNIDQKTISDLFSDKKADNPPLHVRDGAAPRPTL